MDYPHPPRGLIVDLITPLDEKGALDIQALESHIERTTPHVHGILLASPWAGEGTRLSLRTRKELLQAVISCVSADIALLVWITGPTEEATRQNLVALHKACETVPSNRPIYWVDTPLLYHSNRGLPQLYQELYELGSRSFILINDPDSVAKVRGAMKRKNIRTSVLKELSGKDFISGVIFLGPLERAYNYQKATRAKSGFRLYEGNEARFLEYPSLSGVISAGANLAPQQWRKVTDSSLNLAEEIGQYPDSLKQLWQTGQFLHQLHSLYSVNKASLIKSTLGRIGILNYTGGTDTDEGNLFAQTEKIVKLISQ